MSDVPPADGQHEVPPEPPSTSELAAIAVPASGRLAPRFGRVIGTGAWIGIVGGGILGLFFPNTTEVGRGVSALLGALALGALGALLAAAVAVMLDGRDPARVEPKRRRGGRRPSPPEADAS